ncbi:MAG: hypothetical protein EZS28_027190, partial [Streblomastix strix]
MLFVVQAAEFVPSQSLLTLQRHGELDVEQEELAAKLSITTTNRK